MIELLTQMLQQTTESVQKLYDLASRTDEKVINLQNSEKDLRNKIHELNQIISTIDKNKLDDAFYDQLTKCQSALLEIDKKLANNCVEFDKRITALESSKADSANRWEKISNFALQLIWVIIAAWVLASLGLQSPP